MSGAEADKPGAGQARSVHTEGNREAGAIWSLYLLRCDDGALYTGISTDVQRRLQQHRSGRGARSLRRYTGLELVYAVAIGERSLALRAEYRVKRLSPGEKRRLLALQPERSILLARLGLS